MQTPSVWKSRLPLFAVLGALLAVNVVLLVSYNLFYDDRFRVLVQEEKDLSSRYDESRKALRKVEESQQRLAKVQATLEEFFSDTLGSRQERLAPLIEEIYRITRKAKLRPKNIAYSEADSSGAEEIRLAFSVEGTYADVKGLLAEFEASPSFLVVDGVSVGLNEDQPDLLRVGLSITHYFRPDAARPMRKGRAARAPAAATPGGVPQ
jgi:Tfp pilus assembly protein PilO